MNRAAMQARPVVIPAGEQQAFAVAGSIFRLIARSEHTGSQFALYETTILPERGSAAHVHSRESESFLILAGSLLVYWGDRTLTLSPGDFVTFPPGCIYGFRNEGTEPVRLLTILIPGGLEHFLEKIGTPVAADAQPPTVTPAEAERVVAEARNYAVEFPQ